MNWLFDDLDVHVKVKCPRTSLIEEYLGGVFDNCIFPFKFGFLNQSATLEQIGECIGSSLMLRDSD